MWCIARGANLWLNVFLSKGLMAEHCKRGLGIVEGLVRRPPNCWGIGRWGHMEDFLPIPWLPIHPYSRGGGRLRQGQDGGVRTQPCHTNPGLSKWPSYLRVGPDPSSDETQGFKTIQNYCQCHLFWLAHAFNLLWKIVTVGWWIYAVLQVEHKKRH